MKKLKPTPEQQAILDAMNAPAHLKIIARAGSAKTTTLIMAAGATDAPGFALAFNKRIATELEERIPLHIRVKTLNAFGHGLIFEHFKKHPRINARKIRELLKLYLNPRKKLKEELEDYIPQLLADIRRLKALGYAPGFNSLLSEEAMIRKLSIKPYAPEAANYLRVVKEVSKLSLSTALQGKIDFDDQVLLPVALDLMPEIDFENLFVDEAQDLNPCNIWLVRRLARQGARIVAAGDPRQAIYQFRGAVQNSFEELFEGLHVQALSLTTCFRSALPIVKNAQKLVPDIRPWKTPPAGKVLHLENWTPEDIRLHRLNAIICRYNAPLVRLGMQLVAAGFFPKIPFFGDMTTYMQTLARKYPSPAAFDKFVEEKIAASNDPKSTADTYLAIRNVLQTCDFSQARVKDFGEKLNHQRGWPLLTTIHKAKGLEWNNVGVLDLDKIRDPEEETLNLKYVAITRAKHTLVYLSSAGFKFED